MKGRQPRQGRRGNVARASGQPVSMGRMRNLIGVPGKRIDPAVDRTFV
jgi:hypothetical protein